MNTQETKVNGDDTFKTYQVVLRTFEDADADADGYGWELEFLPGFRRGYEGVLRSEPECVTPGSAIHAAGQMLKTLKISPAEVCRL